jgi:protoporphyrinogen oxidase
MGTKKDGAHKLAEQYDYVVIGAGISALTTAYRILELQQAKILIIENEETVGGMSRTLRNNGWSYDIGSHRIHKESLAEPLRLIENNTGSLLIAKERKGRIRLNSRYIDYPIAPANFFLSIGASHCLRCTSSFVAQSIKNIFNGKDTLNYKNYLIKKVGRHTYNLFYAPYAQKLWGKHPSSLSVTAAKKRRSTLSPLSFLHDFILSPNHTKSGPFFYIKNGIGTLTATLEKKLIARNVEVVTKVTDFNFNDQHTIVYQKAHQNTTVKFD